MTNTIAAWAPRSQAQGAATDVVQASLTTLASLDISLPRRLRRRLRLRAGTRGARTGCAPSAGRRYAGGHVASLAPVLRDKPAEQRVVPPDQEVAPEPLPVRPPHQFPGPRAPPRAAEEAPHEHGERQVEPDDRIQARPQDPPGELLVRTRDDPALATRVAFRIRRSNLSGSVWFSPTQPGSQLSASSSTNGASSASASRAASVLFPAPLLPIT